MQITLLCPSCLASLTFAENLAGKTVKCRECGEQVTVKPPVAKTIVAKPIVAKKIMDAEPVEDDEPVRPKKKAVARKDDDDDAPPRKSAKKPVKKARLQDDDEDEEEDEEPKKSMMPILIAVVALVLVGGGVIAAVTMSGSKKPEVVAVTPTTKAASNNTSASPPPTTPITPPTAPEYVAPKPTIEPPPVKPVEPPVVRPVPIAMTTKRPTRSDPDQETLDRLIKASVYLEVEDGKGGGSSGSGWFGLEPNLIFTNAHVVGMKTPGSKPPTKITAFINAGDKATQFTIPHAKLKLLAVDRDMDLAVLEVINEKNVPAPLTIRPTQSLGRLERLVALGYPGGRRLAKSGRSTEPPGVTVSQTTVQNLRKDDNGNLYDVQVQGGVVHGNSGGPFCDADGNVVGIVARVDLDREGRFTNIAFGVPTEYVSGLLAGRIANVEYGQAYFKDGKVAIPVTVRCVDPRKRLLEVGIAHWVGDDDPDPRPPGEKLSPKPGDAGPQELKLTYNPEKQESVGEIVFPAQQAGRAYWCQPYYVNAISPKYYMGGNKIKMSGSPVDQVAADLSARYRVGSRRTLTIGYTRNITEFEEGDGADRSERLLKDTTFTMTEQVTKAPDAMSVAGLTYGFKSWEFKLIAGDDSDEIPKDVRGALEPELQNTTLKAKATKLGAISLLSFTPNGPPVNSATPQVLVIGLGNQAFDMIRKGSIPLPGRKMEAGQSWIDSATITIKKQTNAKPPPKGPRPMNVVPAFIIKEYKAKEEVKYTYLGLRDHGGKKEIVVLIEGNVVSAPGAPPNSASGTVKGIVRIDELTGMVVESEIKHEFEIDTSEKGVKQRISGIEEIKLSRGPAGN
jgi:S1-C subfamily serine protease